MTRIKNITRILLALSLAAWVTRSFAADEAQPKWEFSATAFTYVVPDDDDYIQPTFTVDRDWLHLEARYNYEAEDTASLWAGYNLSGGEELTWELTPMAGYVFGDREGVAPGYKGSLGWRRLELYSEGEYLYDTEDSDGSYFYNWCELTFAPADWCRFGIVSQHTQAYNTERDIQRGFLAGVSLDRFDLTAYVFNPDKDAAWVFSVGFNF
jgi:hypothetical protein